MPSGGSIIIKTGRTTFDQEFSLTHSGAHPGTYTVLSIEDSSPGMDSERVTRVFDLPSEIFDSASLSLPIVYSIVKRFGGYITVKSPSGQGTTFDIYFPSIPTPPSTFAPPDEVDNSRSQSHEAPGPTHAVGRETGLLGRLLARRDRQAASGGARITVPSGRTRIQGARRCGCRPDRLARH